MLLRCLSTVGGLELTGDLDQMRLVGRPVHHCVILPALEVLVNELFRLLLDGTAEDHLIEPLLVLLLEWDLLDANLNASEAIDRMLLESLALRLHREIPGMTWMHADVDWSNILCAG